MTSRAPEKIIPTLRSRIIELEHTPLQRGDNPHQAALDQYVKEKNPTLLLQMTLAPSKEAKFDREDALWIIAGLQEAIECGRLSSRHAHRVLEARATLESSNTIAKYLIDRLLIDIACD